MLKKIRATEEAAGGDLAVPSEEGKIGVHVASGKFIGIPKDKGKQANRREDQTDQGGE